MRDIFFAILGLITGGVSVYLFSSVKLQRQLASVEEKLKQATRSLDEMDTLRSQQLSQSEALQTAQAKIQSLKVEYHTKISELEADYQVKVSQYKQKIQEQQSSLQVYQTQILELQKNYQQQANEMDNLRSQQLSQSEALQQAQTKIQSLEIEYHTQISELEADYQAKVSQYKQKIQEQQSSLQIYQAQILELQKNHPQQISDEIKEIPLDFQYLQTLLEQKEWQKADIETTRIMLAIANQTISLTPETINNFPCQDLAIIDYLWCQYSNNRFGFSVQKEILSHYFTVQSHPINLNQESWEKVGKLLGWYINEKWPNNHNDLVFSLENAAQGHLPFLPLWQGAWWGAFIGSQGERFNLLMQRIEQCKLHYDQEVRPKAQ
jgi:hypothetical protein